MIAWWYPIMVATGEKGKLGLLVTPKWAQALPLDYRERLSAASSPPTSLCIAEVSFISMSLFIFKRNRPGLHACPDLASEPKLLMSSPCPHCTWAPLSWLKSLCTFSSCFSFIFHFLTPSSLVSATALYYDCFCPGQFWVCHLTPLHTTPYWRALGPCFRGLPPPHTLFWFPPFYYSLSFSAIFRDCSSSALFLPQITSFVIQCTIPDQIHW